MLQCIADSDISIDDALLRIKTVPFADLSYAEPDCHREIRQGIAEVIYGQKKTAEQIIGIADTLQAHGQKTVLITRLDIEKAKAVNKNFPGIILIFSYGSSFLIGCLALLSV